MKDAPALDPWRIAQEEARALAREARRYATLTRPATLARTTERDPDWRDRAACVGSSVDAFFPLDSDAAGQAAAQRVCGGCPVRDDCLAFATTAREEHGVWGGLSAAERRSIKRRGVGRPPLARRAEAAA